VAVISFLSLVTGCSYLGGDDQGSSDSKILKIFVHSNGPMNDGFAKINNLFEERNSGFKVEFTTAVRAHTTSVERTPRMVL